MELLEVSFKTEFTRQLLDQLLDKYEQSKAFITGKPSNVRPQISLVKSLFWSDYTDEMDFRKRLWMNEAASGLEARGIVELRWSKFRAGEQLERVYLAWGGLEEAYRLAERIPKRKKLKRMQDVLLPLTRHPWDWVKTWAVRVNELLAAGNTAHLELDDTDGYQDLVLLLQELPLLEQAEPVRLVSQRLFKDSKHLERCVQRRLLSLAKQASGEERETEEEWLDYLGLVKNPQSVLISGPLTFLTSDNAKVDTRVFAGGVGLSAQTVENMRELRTDARRIVTIENLTSYHQWISRDSGRREAELVLYTGGFPHRTMQSFLRKLAMSLAADERVEVFHWGDIDLGGIRIFEYLRDQFFPALQPMLMDVETLLRYESSAAAISPEYARNIAEALADARLARWQPVLQTMRERGIRLEQESIVELEEAI
ncbi:MAG TPA: Wadjet anti-phage system protein JetD domain-containing protein [Bacillales bacterium]